MKSTAVIVFLKAPRPGKVKTRLTPFLSPEDATSFYQAIASDTLKLIASCQSAERPITVWLAWDGPINPRSMNWIPLGKNQYQLIRQKGKTLGERLIHAGKTVSRETNSSPLIFLGTDCLGLEPKLIQKAASLLRPKSVVIGPARDGGYYLIGLSHMQEHFFQGIDWSTSRVFSQTLKQIKKAKMNAVLLPKQVDVDEPSDLIPFLKGQKKISRFFSYTKQWKVGWNASRK